MTIIYNKNASGGTELMAARLERVFCKNELNEYQIFMSRLSEPINENLKSIICFHDLPEDPESYFLQNQEIVDKFSAFVFVSYHQQTRYLALYPNLPRSRCFVIENAIEPITNIQRNINLKNNEEIKLIYTSTPHRGLHILLNCFDSLSKTENISLDVFSSFNLYGWGERDKQFQNLFDFCKTHPKITYHGTQPNNMVREYLGNSHIFCLPSIWEETSCLCMIEAMSADNICVHSSLGALPETTMGLQFMYQYTDDEKEHHYRFYDMLRMAIKTIRTGHFEIKLPLKAYVDVKYGLRRYETQWRSLFHILNN